MSKKKKIKKKKVKTSTSKIILPTVKTVMAQSVYGYIHMLYGPPGIGKTSFADEMSDSTFFISTDRGTRFLPALRLEVYNWEDLLAVIKTCEREGVEDKYKIICLDHVDDICTMSEDYTCSYFDVEGLSDVGYNKGWRMYKQNIWGIMQRILALNVGLVLITHETIKTVKTKVIETQRAMPDLTKSAWKVLVPKCDLVGYCAFKTVKRKGGKKRNIRIIRTSPLESIYAKDRTRREKPEDGWEPLNAEQFIETFEVKGVTRHAKKKKKKSKKSKKARRSY